MRALSASGGIANGGGYYRLTSTGTTKFDSSTISGNKVEGNNPTGGNISAAAIFRNSIISGGQAGSGTENWFIGRIM